MGTVSSNNNKKYKHTSNNIVQIRNIDMCIKVFVAWLRIH